jgi:hypothetical protein
MHSDLNLGTAKRTLTEAELNIHDTDDGGDPLFAAGYHRDLTLAVRPQISTTPVTIAPRVTPLTEGDLVGYLIPAPSTDLLFPPTVGVLDTAKRSLNSGVHAVEHLRSSSNDPNSNREIHDVLVGGLGKDELFDDVNDRLHTDTAHDNVSVLSEWLVGNRLRLVQRSQR